MKNKKLYLAELLLILFSLFSGLNSADALTIGFNDIVKKAVDNSYDLKISKTDIDISRVGIKDAKSQYYPTVKTGFNSEYARDLTGGQSVFSSVGSTVLVTNTKYQDLLSLNLSYSLYDFGIRGRRLSIAKKDYDQKKLVYNLAIRDMKIQLIELYTRALLLNKEIIAKKKILPVYRELTEINQRLCGAGSVSKIEVANASIRAAKINQDINSLNVQYKKALAEISEYTKERYIPETTDLEDFKKSEVVPVSFVTSKQTLESKVYQLEIDKKKAELEIKKRERLPVFGVYSNYILYGTDTNSIVDSFTDFSDRNLMLGVSASMPLFDGFKNSAEKERIVLEIKRLELVKNKKVEEVEIKQEELNDNIFLYAKLLRKAEETLKEIEIKQTMVEKLVNQQIKDRTAILEQKEELISQKLECEKTIVSILSSIESLKTLSANSQ